MTAQFKIKLKENKELCLGSWITLGHPSIAEIMCNSAYDWLCVDLEHSTITLSQAEDLIRVIDLSKKTPLVRLSNNDPIQIKRVMDAGAQGIIVPMVNSLKDAKDAFASIHYPPLGKRGVGLARAQKYGSSFKEYQAWLKESSILVVQIEHIEAVNNLEEIFSYDGIDAFIIGPYDLSASMGMPGEFNHPDFLNALTKIKEAGVKFNLPGGTHVVEPDVEELKNRISDNYKFIAYSVDIRMIDSSCNRIFSALDR